MQIFLITWQSFEFTELKFSELQFVYLSTNLAAQIVTKMVEIQWNQ